MLFKRGRRSSKLRFGAIIDIGSGSVGVAIVLSESGKKNPEIVWSYRERMPVRRQNTKESEKRLISTLLNVLMILGKDGIKNLQAVGGTREIKQVAVNISAPWSYTVTRTIHMRAERPFRVTRELLDELIEKSSDQAKSHISEKLLSDKLDLSVINNTTVKVTENGYVVNEPYRDDINKLSVSQLIGMTTSSLEKTIIETVEKILPSVNLEIDTFAYTYYQALSRLSPKTNEACLIDITAEATEIGIIRRGILEVSSHVPYGSYTLANSISTSLKITPEEALSYLRTTDGESAKLLSGEEQQKVNEVIAEYEAALVELFQRTGDALSLPRTIFMHTDHHTEKFFSDRITNSAHSSTNIDHSIHLVTSKFFSPTNEVDSALLLSAYVFHAGLYGKDPRENTTD